MGPPAAGAAVAVPRPAPGPGPSQARAALALSMLLGLQPVTTDVYLPALPALTRELAAPMARVQLTLSALILSFGIAQLVWGPVADRIGRRPVLLAGLTLFIASSAGSAMAGSVEALVGWRVAQGVALAAVIVCARAIVRDLYEPHQGARVMSLALSGLGLVAIVGPPLGGLLAAWWGWRSALASMAVAGAVALAFVVWGWPETLPRRDPHATRAGPLLRTWSAIARHPTFVAWTLLVSSTYGALYSVLAGSSFVYIDVLGLRPSQYGLAMAVGSVCYLGGTFVCRRWIARHGLPGAVTRAAFFNLAGGAALAAVALAGIPSAWALLLPQCLLAFAHGVHQPCGQTGAVGPFPRHAGAASALAGFALAVVAFAIGLWLGQALDGSVRPYALTVAFWAGATALAALTLVRRLPR